MRARGVLLVLATGLAGCASVATPQEVPSTPQISPVSAIPGAMQYLYGSAEAAALSLQTYNILLSYVRTRLESARDAKGRLPFQRPAGTLPRWGPSAILGPGATAAMPDRMPCAALPPAVVLDMDETAVLNLGYEYDDARDPRPFDAKRWENWEKTGADAVVAVPGAVAALRQLRASGVTVVVNTNRNAATAAATERALANAGLGTFRHGETLFLKGDVDGRSGKDARRAEVAKHYCVLAQAGDQLGDFADLFNPPGPAPAIGRRALATVSPLAALWGAGWFVLPNPVYGTGLGSGWDETFPNDRKWSPTP